MSVMEHRTMPDYLREARQDAGCISREIAAMRVNTSAVTIGRHERGDTNPTPEDAIQYAQGYERPDLMLRYCADCEIGRLLGKQVVDRDLGMAALRLQCDVKCALDEAERLTRIAYDGVIDDSELDGFYKSMNQLETLEQSISEMRLYAMTHIRRGRSSAKETTSDNLLHHYDTPNQGKRQVREAGK